MGGSSVWKDLSNLCKTYWSLFLGNTVEWYEFATYGYTAPILEKLFFKGSAVGVWLGFGVTFLARPLGGAFLGVLGDALGRSMAVNISIIGMLVATCGQGLLPTYENGDAWGNFGLCALVFLRFLQGLSAAGEISTVSTYIVEVAPHRTLGRSVSLIFITINAGFLLAKAVTYTTLQVVGHDAMQVWGWRVPFIFALVPALAAIWGRKYLPESEEWEASALNKETEKAGGEGSPKVKGKVSKKGSIVGTVCSSYWRNILVGSSGAASVSITQYCGFIWMNSYLAHHGMTPDDRMQISLVSRCLMIALCLPVGWLADIKGAGWVMLVGAALVTAASLPLFSLIAAHPADLMVVMGCIGIGFSIMSVVTSTVFFLFIAELFPAKVRGTGAGIAFNLGFAIFGGLSPMIAQESLELSSLGPGILLMAGGAMTVLAMMAGLALEKKGLMKMAHVRPVPYLGAGMACPDDETSDESSDEESSGNAE